MPRAELLHARNPRESRNERYSIWRTTAFPTDPSSFLSLSLVRIGAACVYDEVQRACARLRALDSGAFDWSGRHLAFRVARTHKVHGENSLPAIPGNSIPGNDFTPRVTPLRDIGRLSLSIGCQPAPFAYTTLNKFSIATKSRSLSLSRLNKFNNLFRNVRACVNRARFYSILKNAVNAQGDERDFLVNYYDLRYLSILRVFLLGHLSRKNGHIWNYELGCHNLPSLEAYRGLGSDKSRAKAACIRYRFALNISSPAADLALRPALASYVRVIMTSQGCSFVNQPFSRSAVKKKNKSKKKKSNDAILRSQKDTARFKYHLKKKKKIFISRYDTRSFAIKSYAIHYIHISIVVLEFVF
ncbi:hypothetical protein PUN28_000253 [Cardiocondyla obscurior]|uniref:Uncharacterized protein n=1 Tax=Cardiocondyla obscurior TaxID=286306 RepID=A0AAW2GYX4_9HYME